MLIRFNTLPVKSPCFSLRDVDGEPKSLFVKKTLTFSLKLDGLFLAVGIGFD